MEWQLIKTSPLTGVVDLFVPAPDNRAGFKGFRYTDCYRMTDGRWTSKNFDSELKRTVRDPSHWMYPPDAPLPHNV
jgi:hypothetical protein